MKIGEIIHKNDSIELNRGKKIVHIVVKNTGKQTIWVTSHCHFFKVNRYLMFDRKAAYGFHLNIATGFTVPFLPGEEKEVELVEFGGSKTWRD